MVYSTSKKGRPQAFYRTTWGDRIDGLTRLADGRWKVSGPKPIKFSEADERLAVARFHSIIAQRNPKSELGQAKAHRTFAGALSDVLKRSVAAGGALKAELAPPHLNNDSYVVTDETLSQAQWAWLRNKILTEGKWVAQMVGIEKLGWLTDVNRPSETPTMKALIELYAAKAGLSSNEASRSKLFWKEFTRIVEIEKLGDLSHEKVTAYEKYVTSGKYAPKSILHRYSKVRTILAYAIKRGLGIEHCRRALDITAMLEVKDHSPLDPHPIPSAQFWAIYRAATKAEDHTFATLMLTALNLAMYGGEVSALKWNEINLKTGEVVTRRPKTGVSRVGVLWPEVLAGMRKLERRGEYIFNSSRRSYVVNAVLKKWRLYRETAKLGEDVVFSQIRDAGFTIACGVSLDQARVLAGHRLPGATDFYVRRDPSFVADACRAIRIHFCGAKRTDKKRKAA